MKQRYLLSLKRTTAFVPAMLLAANFAHANPLDGQVVAGSATITKPSLDMLLIQQTTNNAIINWKSFNIDAGETTQFVVPDYTGVTLNRVVGSQDPSKILGTLKSNGTVMVVNPDGILFGPNSVVDVGGLLATTADIEDADFMAKNYQFTKPGKSTASIVNQGMITVKDEGIAALVAPGVRNEGVITAKLGKVTLGAANRFSLDFYGDDLIKLMLDDTLEGDVISTATGKPLSDKVANTGKISADGGTVVLKAATARKVVNSVINNTGVIEANSVGVKDGKIMLFAATAGTKQAGAPVQSVKVSGTLSASGKKKGEKGGKVLLTGEAIEVSNAKIDASGDAGGGTVLIGGDYKGGKATNADLAKLGTTREATIIPTATTVSIDATSTINADALRNGTGGKVIVWADDHTNFEGSISSQGGIESGNGGFAEISGHNTLNFDGKVNLAASKGANGTLLLDPLNVVIGGIGASGLAVSSLENALATSNVVVSTGSTGIQAGDITVAQNVSWNSSNSLTLDAYRNITINSGAIIKNTGAGDLNLHADNSGTGTGVVTNSGSIDYSGSTGHVEVFYNPTGVTKYQNPVSYTSHFSGNGAVTDQLTAYMLVNNVNDLQAMNTNLSGNYALGKDIDASSTTITAPIGNGITAFSGHLNGQFHTLSNLAMNISANQGGLFGVTSSSAIIEKLIIDNATLQGNIGDAGILVGDNYGTIRQVSVNGTITHDAGYAGMVAGVNYGAIDQVSASGNLNWLDVAYGFNTVGGFVGSNESGAVISNSFSHANVNGVGPGSTKTGFAGFNRLGTILNSYSTGSSNGGPGFEVEYSGSVTTNGYWDKDSSGVSYSAGGTGLTTAQLKSGLPTGFSSTFWAIDPAVNGGYPYLKWTVPTAVVTTTLGPGSFVGPELPPSILNPIPFGLPSPTLTVDLGVSGTTPYLFTSPVYGPDITTYYFLNEVMKPFKLKNIVLDNITKKGLAIAIANLVPMAIQRDPRVISQIQKAIDQDLASYTKSVNWGNFAKDQLASFMIGILSDVIGNNLADSFGAGPDSASREIAVAEVGIVLSAAWGFKEGGAGGAVFGAAQSAASSIVDYAIKTREVLANAAKSEAALSSSIQQLRDEAVKIRDRDPNRANYLAKLADALANDQIAQLQEANRVLLSSW